MDHIRGKTIAITGAARGIGHASAKALLQRGARVVIGDRDVHALEAAVTALDRLGPVSGYPLDVTNRQSFSEYLDKARSEGGGHIDVLVNNAGGMRARSSRSSGCPWHSPTSSARRELKSARSCRRSPTPS